MTRYTLLITFLFTIANQAQETGEDKLGSWHAYFGTNKIAERWSWHTEVQLRYYEQAKTFNQSVLRTGINYHINPEAFLTLGYTNVITDGSFLELPDEKNVVEHHIFEQFILKNQVWKLDFEHRYRQEQRFIDFGDGNDTRHILRYRLRISAPLGKLLYLNLFEEIFLNFHEDVFNQNWSYAAIGVKVTDNLSAEVGYININTPGANFDRLSVAVFYNPDLRRLFEKTVE